MRIASLYPTATEIAFAIGAGEDVVGVSHACDHPKTASERKAVTHARFDPSELSSREIYRQKVDISQKFGSLYRLDESALWAARVNVLITQGPGDLPLVSLQNVRAVAEGLNPRPSLLILYPRHLDDVFDDHARVGFEVGRLPEARELVLGMHGHIETVTRAAKEAKKRTVAFLQWLDPPFAGGYWIPQLIEIAGGTDVLNTAGLSPTRVHWPDVRKRNPEIIVVACEDMGIERIRWEMRLLSDRPGWDSLKAVKNGDVYIANGSYFTRAGPRLTEGLDALAWVLNPDLFARPGPQILQRYGA